MRRRRAWMASATAATIATSAVGVMLFAPGAVDASVAVEQRSDGTTLVALLDADADPAEVVAALTDAGLAFRAVPVPVGPSRAGTVLSLSLGEPVAVDAALARPRVEVPAGFDGSITIRFGVDAHGRDYGEASDAFAPGEPLFGLDAESVTVDDIDRVANDREVDVTWVGSDGEVTDRPRGDRGVWLALMTSSDEMVVRVSPAGGS